MQYYRCPEVARLFAAAGFDYVFIDTEHGGFDLETVQDMVAASVAAGITPIVRVSELLYSLMARTLDVGAQGLILPRVEDPRLLEEAISWTRFPPQGKRGFGVQAPLFDYEQLSLPALMEHLNASTLVVVQFETKTALERSDELLSVKGIDVALIGPADLAISLGMPGEFENPAFVDIVMKFVEKCDARGVATGIQCRNAAHAKIWARRGIRFVGAGSEHGLLMDKAKETLAELRAALPLPT
jgi:2-keto-3-deoxy-L-rhamnonate aldolase RhmA